MFLKYTILLMSGIALCLMVMSAGAQTTNENRQAVVTDQQTLGDAYKQLRDDRESGNSAGVLIDQNNITMAEQDFHADEARVLADDEGVLAADQRALDELRQQLQHDRVVNSGAVAGDEADVGAAQQKLQADSQQALADDGLELARDAQALDNEKWQLQQDLRGSLYAVYGPDTVRTDEANIKEAAAVLQRAQLRLQLDQDSLDQAGTDQENDQGQPHQSLFRTVSSAGESIH
jgi:hypothetical protein